MVLGGEVVSTNILELSGPKRFADDIIAQIKRWRYKPALRDRAPVRQAAEISQEFQRVDGEPGSKQYSFSFHREITRAYGDAIASLDSGDNGKAETILNTALGLPQLILAEKAVLANLLAPIMLKKGDFLAARELVFFPSEIANITVAGVRRNLLMFRIQADAGLSDAADMTRALEKYQEVAGKEAKADFVAKMEQQLAELDARDALTISARLPAAEVGEGLRFELYRRHFKFQNIAGRLDKLSLDCEQQSTDHNLSEGLDWRVPPDQRQCFVYLTGQPGTSFEVVEYKN